MTNRREFLKFLALTAAGAAALPEQIAAFEQYYNANAPHSWPLQSTDEVFLAGMATRSTRLQFDVLKRNEIVLALGLNAFGGMLRWVAAPMQAIIARPGELTWHVTNLDINSPGGPETDILRGHISYIDHRAVRHTTLITELNGEI